MMTHAASDIPKELRSKKSIKLKTAYQTQRNNSTGTVLVSGRQPSFIQRRNLQKIIKPCTVALTDLCETQLLNSCHIPALHFKCSKRESACWSVHISEQRKMKEHERNTSRRRSVTHSHGVDRKALHRELGTKVNLPAPEAGKMKSGHSNLENNSADIDRFTVSKKTRQQKDIDRFTVSKKTRQQKDNPHQMKGTKRRGTCDLASNGDLQKKKPVAQNKGKSVDNSLAAHDCYSDVSTSEGEEWLGWDSGISPLSATPGTEVLSVRDTDHVETTLNLNSAVKSYSEVNVGKSFLLKGFTEEEQRIDSTGSCSDVSEEDCQSHPQHGSSSAVHYSFNMMTHPASDISKVLQSKKNLKTKKNFQFKFNNFRRRNGSVGTILSTEGNVFTCFSQTTRKNSWKVGRDLKEIVKPCTVRLTRLSDTELVNSSCLSFPRKHNQERKISTNEYTSRQRKMRKSGNNKPMKPSVRVSSEIDKTKLHLELEKAASTFASEVKSGSCIQFDKDFESTESFIVTRAEEVSKAVSFLDNSDKKGQISHTSKQGSEVFADGTTSRYKKKKAALRSNNKSVSDSSGVCNGNVINDSEEEDWLGWNSLVIPLNTIPGAEIVSVKENGHVENIINWNTKVETDSDMDIEEVFLLTDLEAVKQRTLSTESIPSDSDDDWPGWPEYKPSSALCYIFKV